MAKLRFALVLAAPLMFGCHVFEDPASIQLYASVTHTILQTELNAGVVHLTDEELADRLGIMRAVVPVTMEAAGVASEYLDALETETYRRAEE
ncbi:unnamed protein product [marine sediment metagenome]|uniref:Uncharacterized protein n=1 Tax=marine sediment metagenome TaxID=412755 RepID=X0XJH9_9ZZZZ